MPPSTSLFADPVDPLAVADLGSAPADRRARRGPAPLPADEKREHCVSVRLNAAELKLLEAKCGAFPHGAWLRMAALDQLPPAIPEANRLAWIELARVAANLNQAQAAVNRRAVCSYPAGLFKELRDAVSALRNSLIGVPP